MRQTASIGDDAIRRNGPRGGDERSRNRDPRLARRCRRSNGGFTLAETLAALAFMAIVLPVIIQGLTIASRAGVVAERSAVATRLASNKLAVWTLTEDARGIDSRGDFGPEHQGYRWQRSLEPWGANGVERMSITVTFLAQGREHTVTLSTLVVPER